MMVRVTKTPVDTVRIPLETTRVLNYGIAPEMLNSV